MATRYDAMVAREYTDRDGNKKTQWTKIGAAFPTKNGGYSITLDVLPLPTMGERGLETRILLMEPKPRDGGQRQSSTYDADDPRTHGGGELNDEIPF